jgi:hypothetical protein
MLTQSDHFQRSIFVFVILPDEDGPLLRDGHHVGAARAVLNASNGAGLGLADSAEASLFVFPNLEMKIIRCMEYKDQNILKH